ncbi:intracellular ribonuclease LX [Trifolium repens]|nr:intracellular ribonuclease LX [Trifolium repens]
MNSIHVCKIFHLSNFEFCRKRFTSSPRPTPTRSPPATPRPTPPHSPKPRPTHPRSPSGLGHFPKIGQLKLALRWPRVYCRVNGCPNPPPNFLTIHGFWGAKEGSIYQSLVGSVVIDAELGREYHDLIPRNCNREGAGTT